MPRPPEVSSEVVPEPLRRRVELRFAPEVKRSIGSVFLEGIHRPAVNALGEGVDNVVDARNKTGETSTTVHVTRGDDRVSILGMFELGMGPDDIQSLVSLGTTEGKGIGVRGIGAEAMAFYLAEDLKIVAKKAGEPFEWTFEDKGYGTTTTEYAGERVVDPRRVNDVAVGRVETILTRLKLDKKDLPGGAELRAAFGERYRPLLPPADLDLPIERTATIVLPPRKVVDATGTVVEVPDRVAMFVTYKKKTEPVRPKPKPLRVEYTEDPQVASTSEGEPIGYWVGEVDRGADGGMKLEPGFEVFFDGRLVRKKEFFGHDARHPSLNNLTGEAHLDNIHGIKDALMINKAQGVSSDAPAWKRVVDAMHAEIAPFVGKLRERPAEIDPRLPSSLIDISQRARFTIAAALGEIVDDDEILAALVGAPGVGETTGQRPPHRRGEQSARSSETLGIKGKPWGEQDGQTVPLRDANPSVPRRRKGFVDEVRFTAFPNGDARRSAVVEESKGSSTRRVLEVNTDHLKFQLLLLVMQKYPHAGTALIEQYLDEEGVKHAASELGGDKADLVRQFEDQGVLAIGKLVLDGPSAAMLKVQPDASELAKKKKKR